MKKNNSEFGVLIATAITVALLGIAITLFVRHYYIDKTKVNSDDVLTKPKVLHNAAYCIKDNSYYQI